MLSDSIGMVNWPVVIPIAFALLLIAAIGLSLLVWLWRDADHHGQPGWVWVLLTLMFGSPILIWLIVRSTTLVKSPDPGLNG